MSVASDLFSPLSFRRGAPMRNRFILAPLTNLQSEEDGRLSQEELRWLSLRGEGGFGLVVTCATYVEAKGQGFRRQLGIAREEHGESLVPLAAALRQAGSLSAVQLYHAGSRAERSIVSELVSSSDDPESGARALRIDEIERVVAAFAAGALRAQQAGFDGVQIHGAHGFLLDQFRVRRFNRREDRYGGSLENRTRIYFDVLDAIRAVCRPDFQICLRISPDRFGSELAEDVAFIEELLRCGKIDALDLSFADIARKPTNAADSDRPLLSYFTALDRRDVRIGAAGLITGAAQAAGLMQAGLDFVSLGKAGMLHHDFPKRARTDAAFVADALPVSAQHLQREGLGPRFVDYMRTWPNFVSG